MTRSRPRVATLFSYDWDSLGFGAQSGRFCLDRAGFDLFSFPSNTRLAWFDLRRFARAQARRGRRRRRLRRNGRGVGGYDNVFVGLGGFSFRRGGFSLEHIGKADAVIFRRRGLRRGGFGPRGRSGHDVGC